MKKVIHFLRKTGVMHKSSGDYNTGYIYKTKDLSDEPKKNNTKKTPKGSMAKKIVMGLYLLFATLFLLAALGLGVWHFIIMLLIWGVVYWYVFIKVSFVVGVKVLALVLLVIISLVYFSMAGNGNVTNPGDYENGIGVDGNNVIMVIEAESGSLSGAGSYSRLGESARGGEAYLGDSGARVDYTVVSPQAGTYQLHAYLNDDNLHESGTRSATISHNGWKVQYNHYSEDTQGWKKYFIADLDLTAGENVISFTKDETTSAAFVMDKFELIPVQE